MQETNEEIRFGFKTFKDFLLAVKAGGVIDVPETGDGGFLVPPEFHASIREAMYNTHRRWWRRLAALWAVLRGRPVLFRQTFGRSEEAPPVGTTAVDCRYDREKP